MILDGIEFRVSKMIQENICIKVQGFEVGPSYVRQCDPAFLGPQLSTMHILPI